MSLVRVYHDYFVFPVSPPSILMNPEENIGITLGSNVTFSITVDGIRLAYQWKRGDDLPLLTNDSRFQGVTTRSLTILNVQLSDTGSYICVVSNTAGTVVSTEVMLTVSKCLQHDHQSVFHELFLLGLDTSQV